MKWSGFVSGSGDIQWQFGAAMYTSFISDYNSLGIKPSHSTSLDAYHNGDQAGTSENYKADVIGGARGGGGSNFTGSANCPIIVNAVNSSGVPIVGIHIVLYAKDKTTVIGSCFGPCSFDRPAGTYYVAAKNSATETFTAWSDGTTNPLHAVTISSGSSIVLTAVYSP